MELFHPSIAANQLRRAAPEWPSSPHQHLDRHLSCSPRKLKGSGVNNIVCSLAPPMPCRKSISATSADTPPPNFRPDQRHPSAANCAFAAAAKLAIPPVSSCRPPGSPRSPHIQQRCVQLIPSALHSSTDSGWTVGSGVFDGQFRNKDSRP